ncbi:MAG: 4-hydroxythreonine-4-phosphate dehydrogenase PdxA [Flavobacteriales bacterium]
MEHKTIRLGISVGDMNGIGPEVIMKAFSDSRMLDFCTPVLFCPAHIIAHYRKTLQLKNFHFSVCESLSDIKKKKFNVLSFDKNPIEIQEGSSQNEAGKIAFQSLDHATKALKDGTIDVLVTAPINKQNIQNEDFKFPGHTEYLSHTFDAKMPLMLMVNDQLKIAVATGHIAIEDVSNKLDSSLIKEKARILNRSLELDFRCPKPKLAILGLNPHAGDEGLIGKEEQDYLNQAISDLQDEGVLAFGPFPADGFFGSGAYTNYDAVLAMYHDQGLIPFKTLSFQNGVNYTANLPFVRTSPDHGTAYDLAGKGIADANSFRKAVFQAIDIFRSRTEHLELERNQIDPNIMENFQKKRRQNYNQRQQNRGGSKEKSESKS